MLSLEIKPVRFRFPIRYYDTIMCLLNTNKPWVHNGLKEQPGAVGQAMALTPKRQNRSFYNHTKRKQVP